MSNSSGGIAAIVIIILALVSILGFVIWRNRQVSFQPQGSCQCSHITRPQLKYQNYQLLRNNNAGQMDLFDDEIHDDSQSRGQGGLYPCCFACHVCVGEILCLRSRSYLISVFLLMFDCHLY